MTYRAYIVRDIDSKHSKHGVFPNLLAAELNLDRSRKIHYVLRVETDSTRQVSSFNSQGDLVSSLTSYVGKFIQNDISTPILQFANTHNLRVSAVSPDVSKPFDRTKSIDAEIVGQELESHYNSEPVLA